MSVELKDGTQTEDPRLDRLVLFDEQSRQYPIRTVVPDRPPRSYTWSLDAALDQGREGACVGFGWSHALLARPQLCTNIDARFAREKIYWPAQRIDPWPGGAYPGASPRYEGTAVLAGAKTVAELGAIGEYRWAFGLEDVLVALSFAGPVVLGLNWYEGMFQANRNGFIAPTGRLMGGHCIAARGLNVRQRTVTLHNSWGPRWSRLGASCLITWDDLDRLLQEDGEACIPMSTIRRWKAPSF